MGGPTAAVPDSECAAIVAARAVGRAWQCCLTTTHTCDGGHITAVSLAGPASALDSAFKDLAALPALGELTVTLEGPIASRIPSSVGLLSGVTKLTFLKGLSPGFSGPLPDSLARISNLTWLDLSNNSIRGPFPAIVGNLTNLQRLDLSRNQLSGPIPGFLGRMLSLDTLLLNNNNLSGSIPDVFSELTKLTNLDLSFNSLSGPIPESLAKARSLKKLRLKNNDKMRGVIPSDFAVLPQLEEFDLSSSSVVFGDFRRPNAFQNIKSFDLSNTKVSAAQFGFLARDTLKSLGIVVHNGVVPDWIKSATNLTKLRIANTGIADLPAWLSTLENLRALDLSGNNLTVIPPVVAAMRNLTFLDLSNNRISDGLSVVKILNTGCALNLASNKLSAPISDICGGKKVKWNGLDISFNNISGDVSQCFQRQSMTFLRLSDNPGLFGNADVRAVGSSDSNMPSLSRNCDFSGTNVCAPSNTLQASCNATCSFDPTGNSSKPQALLIIGIIAGAIAGILLVIVVKKSLFSGPRRDARGARGQGKPGRQRGKSARPKPRAPASDSGPAVAASVDAVSIAVPPLARAAVRTHDSRRPHAH